MIYRYRRSIGDTGYGFLAAYVATIVGSVLYRAVTRFFDFWDAFGGTCRNRVKSRRALPGSRP
jgi:hypothetical protein